MMQRPIRIWFTRLLSFGSSVAIRLGQLVQAGWRRCLTLTVSNGKTRNPTRRGPSGGTCSSQGVSHGRRELAEGLIAAARAWAEGKSPANGAINRDPDYIAFMRTLSGYRDVDPPNDEVDLPDAEVDPPDAEVSPKPGCMRRHRFRDQMRGRTSYPRRRRQS